MCTNKHHTIHSTAAAAPLQFHHSIRSCSCPLGYGSNLRGCSIVSQCIQVKTFLGEGNLPLDATNGTDSHVLIPQLSLRKAHNILRCDGTNHTLDLLWSHSASSGDDLTSDILGNSGCPVERKEDGCLELCLGSLDFTFANIV